jgi:predicted phage tail protein
MSNVKLSWVDPVALVDETAIPAGLFDHVDVQMSADGGANFTSVASVAPGAQTYTVTDLPVGKYQFNVYAVDALGRSSAAASVEATIAPPVPATLKPVSNLTANVVA